MATSTDGNIGTIVQAWVPVDLAQRLRDKAATEKRSLSAEIRRALLDYLDHRGDG